MWAEDKPFWTVTVSSAASSALRSSPSNRGPDAGRERHRHLQLGIIIAAGPLPGLGPAMVEHIFALAVGLQIGWRGGRNCGRRARPGSAAGVQPLPSPTLPDSSSSDRKAWLQERVAVLARARPIAPAAGRIRPRAIRATISASRSAIAFPDKRVGVNFSCLALGGRCGSSSCRPASAAARVATQGLPSAARSTARKCGIARATAPSAGRQAGRSFANHQAPPHARAGWS